MWTLDGHQRYLNMDCRDVCKIVFASAKDVMQRIFKVRHSLVINYTFCITKQRFAYNQRTLHVQDQYVHLLSKAKLKLLILKWVNI